MQAINRLKKRYPRHFGISETFQNTILLAILRSNFFYIGVKSIILFFAFPTKLVLKIIKF